MHLSFEWDAAKAATNLRKHRVSFELAARVFADPLAWSHQDRVEGGEQRWQTIGMVDGALLLLVAHTVRDDESDAAAESEPGEVIRIISARTATRKEKRNYEKDDR